MKLINPSDDELNRVFAEKVAGWKSVFVGEHSKILYGFPSVPTGYGCGDAAVQKFTDSADAVLPWLGIWQAKAYSYGMFWVNVGEDAGIFKGNGFARTAVIAKLLACGIEIEFPDK